MRQNGRCIYNWHNYEKIILGLASAWGWVYVVWAVFLPDIMAVLGWIMSWGAILQSDRFEEIIFISFVIICLIIHGLLFGVLAYLLPRLYLFPTVILIVCHSSLGLRKIALFLKVMDDPDRSYYFGSDQALFGHFSSLDVYLPIIELAFLIALLRPAFFYLRRLVGR